MIPSIWVPCLPHNFLGTWSSEPGSCYLHYVSWPMGMPEDFRVPIPLLQSIINTGINLLRFSKELPGDQTTRFPMGCEPDGSHRKEGFHTDEVTAASQWWWNVLTIHDGVSGCYNPFLFFTFLNRGAYWLFKQILAQLNVMLFKIVSSVLCLWTTNPG